MNWIKLRDENGVFLVPHNMHKAVLVANKTVDGGFLKRERDGDHWSKDNFNAKHDTHWAQITIPLEDWEEAFEDGYNICPNYISLNASVRMVAREWFRIGYMCSKQKWETSKK